MEKPVMVVTGASRGIGAEIALEAAQSGYFVIVNYRASRARAEAVCEKIRRAGGVCAAVCADISTCAGAAQLYEKTMAEAGRIDVLVNNAGVSSFSLFQELSEKVWDETFGVNVRGNFLVTRAFVSDMIRAKKGKIINISSIWGLCGASCEVHYAASKAAVIGMTKALAKELGPSGITVNCVAPGLIDTEMNASLSDEDKRALVDETPLMRIGSTSDVAKAVLFLASEAADFITGQVLSPNGGFVI